MDSNSRAGKGKPRNHARRSVGSDQHRLAPLPCIEKGLLRADQIALTTFCRLIREYELLKEDVSENNLVRDRLRLKDASHVTTSIALRLYRPIIDPIVPPANGNPILIFWAHND